MARRPLAANSCVVDRSGPASCNARPRVAFWKMSACVSTLVNKVGYSVARSRRLAPLGLTLFERNIPNEDEDAGPGRVLTQSRAPRGAPSRESAGQWPSAHSRRFDVSDAGAPLRSPSRSRPIAADVGGNDSPPSAPMAGLRAQCMPGSTLAAFMRRRRTSPSSSLTSSFETWPDLFDVDRGADVSRVILFVS